MDNQDRLLSSYEYYLPESRIAQLPTQPVHNAKMMVCTLNSKAELSTQDQIFLDLPNYLHEEYILFLNRTKVFKARIPLFNTRIIRKSGKELILEEGEIFVYQIHSPYRFEVLVSDSKNFKPGSQIFFEDGVVFKSLEFTENGILFEIETSDENKSRIQIFDFLEKIGEMPLPPYIQYEKEKEEWYQTFFAEEIGSAAAPTASLHFSPELIKQLEKRGVNIEYLCLHVGLGTFKPVYEEVIDQQKLHCEPMLITGNIWKKIADAKNAGKKFLPVGTTMIRYLESLPYIRCYLKKKNQIFDIDSATVQRWNVLTKDIEESLVEDFIPDQELDILNGNIVVQTRLFIRPGIPFYLVDELITNFHLPKSSLMMLISAFMGRKNLLNCYQEAIEKEYSFYSFGDGMLVRKE